MSRVFRSLTLGLAAAGLLAGTAIAAESKVRVTNGAVNPVSMSIGKQSKDIRPRKSMTFTVEGTNPTYSLMFANMTGDRGELDMSGVLPVTGPDGLQYRCLVLRDDGFDFDTSDVCDAKVNKKK